MYAIHHKLRMLLTAATSPTDLIEVMDMVACARRAGRLNDAYTWNLYEYLSDLLQAQRAKEKERQTDGAA